MTMRRRAWSMLRRRGEGRCLGGVRVRRSGAAAHRSRPPGLRGRVRDRGFGGGGAGRRRAPLPGRRLSRPGADPVRRGRRRRARPGLHRPCRAARPRASCPICCRSWGGVSWTWPPTSDSATPASTPAGTAGSTGPRPARRGRARPPRTLPRGDPGGPPGRRAGLLRDGRRPGARAVRARRRRRTDRRSSSTPSAACRAPAGACEHSTTSATVDEDFTAYGLLDHRHTPEMEQAIGAQVLFTPHLAPMTRGILATCYARPTASGPRTTGEALGLLTAAYRQEPFVVVAERSPSTKATRGANTAHLYRPGRPPDRLDGGSVRARQPGQRGGGPGGPVRQHHARRGRDGRARDGWTGAVTSERRPSGASCGRTDGRT